MHIPCWDGLVVILSYVVGHTKDYHKMVQTASLLGTQALW